MSTNAITILTCDGCESEAERHDYGETNAWMEAHGWERVNRRDLCPACLMDQDAAKQ